MRRRSCTGSAEQAEENLAAAGLEPDGFGHSSGELRLREVLFPRVPRTGEFLTDACVRGGCPVCLADGYAGPCEDYGHWIASGDLSESRSTPHPEEPVELRGHQVLVLPLEEHRAALTAYFARQSATIRPRPAQMVEEVLSRPPPDHPLTLPIDGHLLVRARQPGDGGG